MFTLLRIKIGAKAICDPTQTQPEGVVEGWGNSFFLFDHSPVKLTIIDTKLGKQKLCVWGTTIGGGQSQKNPVSVSAMLTGKFLQIRKVFATSSLLAEEFPDTLQYKISR